jgi:uncharacterized protein YndB with AHSA1/START domain
MSATTISREARRITLSRNFSAPRELVFLALSDAELLMQWWGPPSCPVVQCTVDFRPGGVWHYRLRLPDGDDAWARSVYREIVSPERITYLEHSSDASGGITDERPAAYCVITLEPAGTGTAGTGTFGAGTGTAGTGTAGTLLTVTLEYETPLDRDRAIGNGVERGFPAALDQLDGLLHRMGAPQP